LKQKHFFLSNGHSRQIRQNGELLVRMCRMRVTFWRMSANVTVSECIESGEKGWRMSGECIESGERVGECLANVSSPGKVVGECRANVSSPGKVGRPMWVQAR
jgi:hypothetical protein